MGIDTEPALHPHSKVACIALCPDEAGLTTYYLLSKEESGGRRNRQRISRVPICANKGKRFFSPSLSLSINISFAFVYTIRTKCRNKLVVHGQLQTDPMRQLPLAS